MPVWIDQWPLTQEKILAAQALVQEQLDKSHVIESTSPWNSPIFVIKKKSGKWRLLQDLRKVNETMEIMGALQPGLPHPSAIPKDTYKIVLDLKDCFYTIPLHPQDCKRFAFSIPSSNFQEPMKRYQWQVLPQGMAQYPTLCQKFVSEAIGNTRKQFPSVYIIHYMDDILLACKKEGMLLACFADMKKNLLASGLIIAPEKVQRSEPYSYFGFQLFAQYFTPQKIELRKDHLKSLNDFQKLLGDMNWLRPSLGLTTGDLKPLFEILKGDSDSTSPRSLTEPARKALSKVEEAIQQQHVSFLDYSKPLYVYILDTKHTPTAVLWQEGPLRWIHLHVAAQKNLTPYYEFVASLIQESSLEARKYYGKEPDSIVIPFTKTQIQGLMQFTNSFPVALAHFVGTLDNHYPKHKLLQFFQHHDPTFPPCLPLSSF